MHMHLASVLTVARPIKFARSTVRGGGSGDKAIRPENMSTAAFAMLVTIALVELGTKLFPVLEGKASIYIYIYIFYI